MTQWQHKIDNLSIREKTLGLLVVVALLYWVVETIALKPLYVQASVKHSILAQQRSTLDAMTEMTDGTPEQTVEKKQKLKESIAQLSEQLQGANADVYLGVSAKDMVLILNGLVSHSNDIIFEAIQNQAPAQLAKEQLIYRHPIEIQFEGSFFAVLAYTQMLENLGLPIVFETMNYSVENHPTSTMRLRFSFLSQTPDFVEF